MTFLGQSITRHSLMQFLLVAAIAASLSAGLVGLLLNDLMRQKDEIFDEAVHGSKYRARLISDHAARSFEAVDLILFGAASDFGHADKFPPPQAIRNRLHERLLFLPQIVTLAAYGADGNLIADARRLNAQEDVSAQHFFKHHRDEGTLFLLEGPSSRRFDTSGRYSLRLSRLVSSPDGKFLGVLLAEVDPKFFSSFYREEDPFGFDMAALFDSDGTIMASERPDILELGKNIADLAHLTGITYPKSPISGIQQLETENTIAVFHQLPNFTLRVGVMVDRRQLLDSWQSNARETYLIIAGIVTALVGFLIIIATLLQRRTAIEEALRNSEAHLRAVFDHTDIGIIQADTNGTIRSVNPAFARMMGGRPEDFGGKTWREITHPDDIETNSRLFDDLLSGKRERYIMEKRYRRFDNNLIVWAKTNVSLVRLEDNDYPLIFGMVEDITDTRRSKDTIEALLRRSQLLLSAIGEGILGLDPSGRVAFVNPAAESLLGYSAKEMIGRRSHELVHRHQSDAAAHQDADCPMQAVLSDGNPRQVLKDGFWRKDGSMLPVEYVATPMTTESGIEGAVIAFRDVTRQLESDQEIMRSNAELEQFAYAVSHDLQEPLRMVASYVQLLGRRYQGKLDHDADDFISFAVDGAKRMQQMITDLLDYSRIQRKGNPMTSVSLDEPLLEALKNLELSIDEAGVTINIETKPLPTLTADSAQIARLFQNLIGNAIKYRSKDRETVIAIRAKRVDSHWEFDIADNGIGIDPQYFERIFQVFQRLHARSDYPGTGVGLAICRRIVERHGGRIWVTSDPGKGSTFCFTLPAN
ncbi:MAG: PAS domain S-box protein [Alphaproteobacteria bacterium]|nr:PAS domain S-box protein [Alphaproteobacteria bacterium]